MEKHRPAIAKALFTENLSASEIARRTGLSQPTASRALANLPVIRLGKGRASVYAWVESVEGHPVYAVDPDGQVNLLATLYRQPDSRILLIHPDSYHTYDDLPWFLYSVLPAGFLGRLHGEYLSSRIAVDKNPARWSTNEVFRYLLNEADDLAGNLLIGKGSSRLYQAQRDKKQQVIANQYDAIARDINHVGIARYSVAGEQPKFLAYTSGESGAAYHAIVKYSAPLQINSPAAQRYQDLLVAEHLALECLSEHNVTASQSRLLESERLYLEMRRFDRIGEHGRRGIVSLRDFEAEYVGDSVHWHEAADAFLRLDLIDEMTQQQIHLLHAFGLLIANTDMHFGNLSFYFEDLRVQGLAPAYDMLPMMYMPVRDEVVEREFKVAPLVGIAAKMRRRAKEMAQTYWQNISVDDRISNVFREIAHNNQTLLTEAITSTDENFS